MRLANILALAFLMVSMLLHMARSFPKREIKTREEVMQYLSGQLEEAGRFSKKLALLDEDDLMEDDDLVDLLDDDDY